MSRGRAAKRANSAESKRPRTIMGKIEEIPICQAVHGTMSNQETLLNNRYRLIAQQGSGGMAVIYKAIDQALGRTVAVKILRPSLITDPAFLERFRNEARSVAKLTHPNIVTVHDVGQDGHTHYIVMEFVEGQDLKKLIRAQAPFNVDRALHIATQICGGIGYAHRSGLVHADIKPQNILIADEDTVKVTDFGIAQALSDAAGERQKVVWGSPHYFSPEQAQGERPTPASDVYSIGIVLFEMLTGRLPYIGADQQELAMAHIREEIPRVTEFNPTVPPQLEQIIIKVMSKEPASRYRSAEQLGRILKSYHQQGYRATGSIGDTVRPRAPQPTAVHMPAVQWPAAPTLPNTPASPPTQQARPVIPAAQPHPHATQPAPVYSQPTPPPYTPHAYPAVDREYEYSRSQPVRVQNEEGVVNLVTVILGILAAIAVLGLIPLGISVLQAYQGLGG